MGLSVNGAVQRAEQVARWMATQEKFRAKAGEKLSSGLRVNRAADDAAGLSISETLRTQVRGDLQAARNIQDGISLLNVAEGGMDTIAGILQRMRELAVQSAHGVYTQQDRDAIQTEFASLKAQINLISETAEYNGINLLRGDDPTMFNPPVPPVGPVTENYDGFNDAFNVNTFNASRNSIDTDLDGIQDSVVPFVNGVNGAAMYGPPFDGSAQQSIVVTAVDTMGNPRIVPPSAYTYNGVNRIDFNGTAGSPGPGDDVQVQYIRQSQLTRTLSGTPIASSMLVNGGALTAGVDYTLAGNSLTLIGNARPTAGGVTPFTASYVTNLISQVDLGVTASRWFEGGIVTINSVTVDGVNVGADPANGYSLITTTYGYMGDTPLNTYIVQLNGSSVTIPQGYPAAVTVNFNLLVPDENPVDIVLQSGANQGQTTTVEIDRVTLGGLGLVTSSVATQDDAGQAIAWLDEAVSILSANRGKVGAAVNRLEHAYANVTNAAENQQQAYSLIRDTDMASTITEATNREILFNSGASMFKQANYSAQYLLQLLG